MKLGDLKPYPGSVHRRKRVARGPGSGHGKTAGRGHKGQKSRSGGLKDSRRFEGGRSTLLMRLPKRGMRGQVPGQIPRTEYQVVNLARIAQKFSGGEVGPEELVQAGLVREGWPVKILAQGALEHPLTLKAHAFSQAALEKIRAAGGEMVLLGGSS